eukprot:393290_1
MFTLLLTFWIEISLSQSNYGCSISFDHNSIRPSDIRLIGGYNDVLGPVQNLTYFDKGLLLTVNKLYTGILRHPGGTVANYWSIQNASYTQPCNTSHYDYCKHQAIVEKLPPQTFSPANFSKGIGMSSPTINPNNIQNAIVFDLNALTISNQTMLAQVDVLKNAISEQRIKYIELGNEYYLNTYSYEFPDSTTYMNKVLPLINKIRTDLPNAKISVPAARVLPPQKDSKWNDDLKVFKQHFDSVTVHDYSLKTNLINGLSKMDQYSYISSYGRSALPDTISYVRDTFGNKTIWMTEYNINPNVNNNSFLAYSTLHSMFAMSYITTAICDTTNSMELLLLHEYATQIGNQWATYDFITSLSAQADDVNGATFNINGQILAQLAYYSLVKNNQMTCLKFGNSNGKTCPLLNVNIINNDKLQCLFGAGFTNTDNNNTFAFVLVNSCQQQINLDLDISTISSINQNVELDTYDYLYSFNGGIENKFTDCKGNDNVWDKSCAAAYAMYQKHNISVGQTSLSLAINKLSLKLAIATETQE